MGDKQKEQYKKHLQDQLQKHINLVPQHMRQSVNDYILLGLEPGGFLSAVLANDLKGAVGRADSINKENLVHWAEFVMWALPSNAQGSYETVERWCAFAQNDFVLPNWECRGCGAQVANEIEECPNCEVAK